MSKRSKKRRKTNRKKRAKQEIRFNFDNDPQLEIDTYRVVNNDENIRSIETVKLEEDFNPNQITTYKKLMSSIDSSVSDYYSRILNQEIKKENKNSQSRNQKQKNQKNLKKKEEHEGEDKKKEEEPIEISDDEGSKDEDEDEKEDKIIIPENFEESVEEFDNDLFETYFNQLKEFETNQLATGCFRKIKNKLKFENGKYLISPDPDQIKKTLKSKLEDYPIKKGIQDNLHHLTKPNIRKRKKKIKKKDLDQKEEEEEKDEKVKKHENMQCEMMNLFLNYGDLLYTEQNEKNTQTLRELYLVHILNHILKTRTKVMHHSKKIKEIKMKKKNKNQNKSKNKNKKKKNNGEDEDENENENEELDKMDIFRDQGFTRPKVLILVPFRQHAVSLIETMLKLSTKQQKKTILEKRRFYKEFSEKTADNENKPKDYNELFKGNSDDCFRIGVSLGARSIRLFSDFYNSDLIIASPLGLRLVVGGEGDKERDYDFLSSIEITILDHADVLLMQNWEHILTIWKVLNKLPESQGNTDFSRVKHWYLDGQAKYFRQNLIFSRFNTIEINAFFNNSKLFCSSSKGKFKLIPKYLGVIDMVIPQVKQVFQKIKITNLANIDDIRFNFFKNHLNTIKKDFGSYTLIVIPDYFDFIRIRNLFNKNDLSYCICSEDSSTNKIAASRSNFFHGRRKFLLISERFHFFKRYKIRGVKNIIFYGLPKNAIFYSEMLNWVESQNSSCLILYTKYEYMKLQRIVGSKRAKKILRSQKNTHLFC
ncbi:orf protein-related [Anaeramoeba flamelloides]|uniref:Orf protein-related n=1 Tax=Anaeramoeba flamelloides TaxID=1746091 RepID=A0AAV7ZSR1_9EUKA|nr:orf protein-related [Anaeramoeba flamelloides]